MTRPWLLAVLVVLIGLISVGIVMGARRDDEEAIEWRSDRATLGF